MITSIHKLYQLPSKKKIAIKLLLTMAVGSVAALVAVGVLPLIFDNITPKIEIGVAGLAGSLGQKTFDLVLGRMAGHKRRADDR